jgi:hypothetical protein
MCVNCEKENAGGLWSAGGGGRIVLPTTILEHGSPGNPLMVVRKGCFIVDLLIA